MAHVTTRSVHPDSATAVAPDTRTGEAPAWSKPRRIAFRIFSILVALFTLAFFAFGLLEAVFMWLPGETLTTMFEGEEYEGGLLIHRTHFMAIGLVAWAIVPAVLVQLRKPWKRVAPMLQAVVAAIAGAIAYGLSGTLAEWATEDLIIVIPFLGLAALHPRAREIFSRRPEFDSGLLRMAAAAALPWAVYAGTQARLQLLNEPGDPHAGIEHWASAFVLAVMMIACATIGASDHQGWRLSAWTAGLATATFGLHSLVFSGLASALPTFWAVAAMAWGVGYLVLTVQRSRSAPYGA